MRWIRLVLFDAPLFVIGTWLRLYSLVLAVACMILWGGLIVLLVQSACRAIGAHWR
jgi:hypothetical protein